MSCYLFFFLHVFQLLFYAGFKPPHSRLQVKHPNHSPFLANSGSCSFHPICTIMYKWSCVKKFISLHAYIYMYASRYFVTKATHTLAKKRISVA